MKPHGHIHVGPSELLEKLADRFTISEFTLTLLEAGSLGPSQGLLHGRGLSSTVKVYLLD
jgi:hypothetical protein